MSTLSHHTRSHSRQPGTKCAGRACDQCRLRKTRCSLSRPCEGCMTLGFECTFLTPQKKRGPPSRRVIQIRQQQGASTSPDSGNGAELSGIQETSVPHLPNMGTPGVISGLSPNTPDSQVPIPQDDQNQVNHFPNPPRQDYNNSLLSNNTPGSTTWSGGAPELEYWLPDSFSSQPYPSFGFQGSNILIKQSLPPIIDDNVNLELGNTPPFIPREINADIQRENLIRVQHGDVSGLQPQFWPHYINETSLIPWIDVYFDRLHPTLPVLNRSFLFTRIVQHEHRRNPQFGAMILSLCAFSLTQPIDISERPTSSSRADQAKVLVNEATRMRTSPDFGENPSIEAVLTSFFLFGYLFGSNQHNAARLRLREAMDLASTLGLNNPASYADCSTEEKGQWLRTYLVLSVTERAYDLQRQHPITFTGRPLDIIRAADEIRNATQRLVSGIIVHTEKDAAGMMGLSLLMEIFDTIDEDILICWNARCNVSNNGKCHILTQAKALSIYQNLARVSDAERYNSRNDHFDPDANANADADADADADRGEDASGSAEINEARMLRDFLSETQCADILLTQKWVQDRLWNLCFGHGLLQLQPEHPGLSFRYASDNAERALKLCRLLRISAIEAHGVGIIEKIYNIATSAILTAHNTGTDESDIRMAKSPIQVLANNYLKLMQTLRGGNHPYVGQYKAHLMSLGWVERSSGWGP
ncbi:hypothetical protein BDW59DRAFT_150121 [Aspergillus cavernicola]|uniref:Zn(2)-C6 fungal-type domain-containing protein n=1 Tax=Aspergillus cavernicola TaxID=176166 RepID=A0ABR4I147_9EURO